VKLLPISKDGMRLNESSLAVNQNRTLATVYQFRNAPAASFIALSSSRVMAITKIGTMLFRLTGKTVGFGPTNEGSNPSRAISD